MFFAGVVLVFILLLALLWEFFLEDYVLSFIYFQFESESNEERWEYVVTVTCFAAIALVIPISLLARLIEARRKAQDSLENMVDERTAELVRSQRQLHDADSMALLGHWEWDEVNDHATYLSPGFLNLMGVESTEDSLEYWDRDYSLGFVHPDDRDRVESVAWFSSGESDQFDIEFRLIRTTGEEIVIHQTGKAIKNDAGEIVRSFGTSQDITERRRAEGALRTSEEKFHAVANNIPSAVLLKDTAGYYLVANKIWHSWCNPEGKNIEGKTVFDFHHKSHAEAVSAQDKRVLESAKPAECEFTIPFADGKKRTSILQKFPICDSDGHVTAIGSVNTDITERKQAEMALRESEALHKQSARMARLGHWEWDNIEGRLVSVSVEYARIFDQPVDELLTSYGSFDESLKFIHPNDRGQYSQVVGQIESRREKYQLEYRIITRTGAVRHVREMGEPMYDEAGRMARSIGTLQDISERKFAEEALSYQATHDSLTKLINRGEFERRVERVLKTAHASQDEHALCYMDLDQFKVVNDTCGHIAGDALLRQLGHVLSGTVRKRDTLARLGGDEFGVLMEHCTLEQAHRVADEMRAVVTEFRFAWEEQVFRVGVSIGLVPITETSESVAAILSAADSACYIAKDEGRNRVHVYHPDDSDLARRHGEMQWVTRIHRALEEDRFELWSQPIVPVAYGADEGEHFEVLLRLVDEQGETVPPGAFLPAAERYGLSTELDRWVVGAALKYLEHSPERLQGLHLCSINLSGTSLADEKFLAFVKEQLAQSRVPAQKLCFEITETAAIANLSRAITFMTTLKEQGCKFALDDFGSGLSSFAYLKTLPVDYLKIDGSFVRNIVDHEVDLAMVRSINDVGRVMGKATVAEFVEDDAILEKLREIGVDYAQGYGLGRPVPTGETR